ncbi:Secreted RxLR effector peptide protein [Phytophthora palmivora]|uniref:Secreted RxLR effector peptide protein n=1 Tax=Phytophthora palmivora TaxID=4796 RepID=A0A2P4Y6X4_9STRA|nr:Secreted RxLR effector peptide protein [Phytophthora palmivora]
MRLSVVLVVIWAIFAGIVDTTENDLKLFTDDDNRKLGEKEWQSMSEERGSYKFINKLKAKMTKEFDSKTKTLSTRQVENITKEVAREVKKNPKAWSGIKKGLKVLYGTVLAGSIILGVVAMVSWSEVAGA